MKSGLLFVMVILVTAMESNAQMRSVEDLINETDPGWNVVLEFVHAAGNKVEVLPVDVDKAKDALYKTQVTTRSPMGAIVYMTGGILVDGGWIRILGSGSSKIVHSLPDFNRGKTFKEFGQAAAYLVIAYDALGGFFMLNGGGLGDDPGNVYYFSSDNLAFEPLGITYTDFLLFCFNNDLDEFYNGYRWKDWKKEVAKLHGDQVLNFVPALWTKEGKDIEKTSRRPVPVDEQWHMNMDLRKQLDIR